MSAVTSRSGAVAVLLPAFGIGSSLRRIRALVLRYMYLLRSSGIRLILNPSQPCGTQGSTVSTIPISRQRMM